MTEKLIIAGAGGQGVMLLGKILAQAAMQEGKFVTWLPAYGAEVRGGTAYCMVVVSSQDIGSPFVAAADTLIIMNGPSWQKFKSRIIKKGLVILNSSLLGQAAAYPAGACLCPFTDLALSLGNIKVANMIALGYYLGKKEMLSPETVRAAIAFSAPAGKEGLIAINHQALELGLKHAHGKS